jgi:hypothetical protein
VIDNKLKNIFILIFLLVLSCSSKNSKKDMEIPEEIAVTDQIMSDIPESENTADLDAIYEYENGEKDQVEQEIIPAEDQGVMDSMEDCGIDTEQDGDADILPEDMENPFILPECPKFASPVTAGFIQNPLIKEASGIVESHKNPGILWIHNDSGDAANIYAVSTTGISMGIFVLEGVKAVDWEDIALGPGPDSQKTYLYAGDIGDNAESRPDVKIYRVAEPEVKSIPDPPYVTLQDVETFTLKYPDEAHNAETLLVDPLNGDVYIAVKTGNGISPVFRAHAPLSSIGTITMEAVATLTFGKEPLAGSAPTTGGDISADGDEIAIRTYDSAFIWRRIPGGTIAEAFATEPCPIPLANEVQGEALGFSADGNDYYTVSEGSSIPIYFYKRK